MGTAKKGRRRHGGPVIVVRAHGEGWRLPAGVCLVVIGIGLGSWAGHETRPEKTPTPAPSQAAPPAPAPRLPAPEVTGAAIDAPKLGVRLRLEAGGSRLVVTNAIAGQSRLRPGDLVIGGCEGAGLPVTPADPAWARLDCVTVERGGESFVARQ